MERILADKVALVTGAGAGLGKATALRLAQAGATVAVLGRTEHQLQETVDQIKAEGGNGLALIADVREPDAMQQAVAQLIEACGRIDIVFANAGINGVWAPIEELSVEEWDEVNEINVRGTFLTLKYTVPHLKKQGGAVVITASVNGTRMFSNTGATAYAATKAAQVAMAKMLALELAPSKVRVNVICPGYIESQIDDNTEKRNIDAVKTHVEFPEGAVPLTGGDPGKSEDVANLVLFLVSGHARHISGTEIWIDGAQSLLQG